jgi:hypothetical protein
MLPLPPRRATGQEHPVTARAIEADVYDAGRAIVTAHDAQLPPGVLVLIVNAVADKLADETSENPVGPRHPTPASVRLSLRQLESRAIAAPTAPKVRGGHDDPAPALPFFSSSADLAGWSS